jgi:hypothetical protein
MIVWLASVVFAAEVAVIPDDGEVLVSQAAYVQVVAVDDYGRPLAPVSITPGVGALETVSAVDEHGYATLVRWQPPSRPGVVPWTVRLPDGTEHVVPIEVSREPPPALDAPEALVAEVGSWIRVPIVASGPLTIEDLHVWTSDPAAIRLVEGTSDQPVLEVLPERVLGARVFLIGVARVGARSTPAVVRVSIRQSHQLVFDLEPGAQMWIRVGPRKYGPYVAGRDGRLRAVIEQYPGETTAELRVSDEVGNELQSSYVLSARAGGAMLIAHRGGGTAAGGAPADVVVAAAGASGERSSRWIPNCGMDGERGAVRDIGDGLWRVSPPMTASSRELVCTLPDSTASVDLRPSPGFPSQVVVGVEPSVVDADRAYAEVVARLIDGRGDSVERGEISLVASRGEIRDAQRVGRTWRAQYHATSPALRAGVDVVTASAQLPAGEGAVADIALHWESRSDRALVTAFAVDRMGSPIPRRAMTIAVDDHVHEGITDDRGQMIVETQHDDRSLRVVRAHAEGVHRAWAAVTQVDEAHSRPALSARANLKLVPGKTSEVRVEPATRTVAGTPTASLEVYIDLLDSQGRRVEGVEPVVMVDAGSIESVRPRQEGGYVLVYRPPVDGRAQTVTFTVSSPSGEKVRTAQVRVDPRPLKVAVGVGAGATTNLSGLGSPLVSVDADIGLQRLARAMMLRVGVASFGYARAVPTEVGVARKQITLVPVTAAALVRHRTGPLALHGGAGLVLTPLRAEERFDDVRLPPKTSLLVPGFTGVFGVARRLGGGEIVLEARYNWLVSQGERSGFSGQLGGLAALLSYRLVTD